MIYLDYSANTPVDHDVLQAFCRVEGQAIGNANSAHQAGRFASELLHQSIRKIADLLGVSPDELIFTSGASESNNTAIKGILRSSRHFGHHVITTPLEHASVSGCLTAMQEQGAQVDVLGVRRDGTIDVEELKSLLRKDTVLVTLPMVDSELGVVQPLEEVYQLVHQFSHAHLHIDATQAVGKIPVQFVHADTMSMAAHKFYGLNGSGLLLRKTTCPLEPLIHGGVSASLYRSGTPTVGIVHAFEKALQKAISEQSNRFTHVQNLNQILRAEFLQHSQVVINSPKQAIPHILNISTKSIRGAKMQQALDSMGVCVSVKSACSVAGTPSRAVFAIGRDRNRAMNSIRISLSHLTTAEEIQTFLPRFNACLKECSL